LTYRERREAKADRLRDYAGRREAKQGMLDEAARSDEGATGIPFGQPILVGHHSERRHRRVIERVDRAMGAAVDNAKTGRSTTTTRTRSSGWARSSPRSSRSASR
jgi:hypothetical protein